jgi:hypothetical protein
MLTAGVSPSFVNQATNYFQQRQADLQQLGKDLKAGDLNAAQQDFNAIQTLAENGPLANGNAFKVNARQQDFTAIGQALQSGDLAGAQQAYAQLQRTFRHHPHPEPSPAVVVNIGGLSSTSSSVPSPPATQPPDATGASASTGPEIVLNLGNAPAGEQITIGVSNASNGGEQITISLANQQAQTPEQITLNLQPNSNQQIIFNLFNSTADTSTVSAVSVTA